MDGILVDQRTVEHHDTIQLFDRRSKSRARSADAKNLRLGSQAEGRRDLMGK